MLLDAYQEISEQIPLLLQYQNVFQNNPHMTSVLEMIYKDILEFHQQALRVFGKSGRFARNKMPTYWSKNF